jgi:hypothetical protein
MALRVKPWGATALAVDAAIGMRLKEEKASAKARQQENHVVDVLDDWEHRVEARDFDTRTKLRRCSFCEPWYACAEG